MKNSLKLGEIQSINRTANFYTLFYLINTVSRLFEIKSSSMKIGGSRRWKELQKKIYGFIETTSTGFFKQKLILNLPRVFNEELKQLYCSKDLPNNKPTSLFLKLALIIENVNSNLQLILMRNLKDFLLNRFILYIFYVFEYHFYLDYHGNNKNEFKFMIDKDLIRLLDIKMSEFSFYSTRSATKLSSLPKNGMDRFIFDITFLCVLGNSFLKDPKLFINSEEFLARILHVYCKEIKVSTPNDFIIKKEYFMEKLKKYLSEEYYAEKMLIKQKINQARNSNILEQSNVFFV